MIVDVSSYRARFERDGFTVLPGALPPERVTDLAEAVDAVWWRHRGRAQEAGAPPLHLLAFLGHDRRFLELVDHPPVLDLVVDLLGDNVFLYHCHLDVHPPEPVARHAWMWHQDGGVRNRDLETDPRPRLSVKSPIS